MARSQTRAMHTQHLASAFRTAAIAVITVTFSMKGHSQELTPVFDPLDKPNVVEAIRSICM